MVCIANTSNYSKHIKAALDSFITMKTLCRSPFDSIPHTLSCCLSILINAVLRERFGP